MVAPDKLKTGMTYYKGKMVSRETIQRDPIPNKWVRLGIKKQ